MPRIVNMKLIYSLLVLSIISTAAAASRAHSEPIDYAHLLNKYGSPVEVIEKETLRQNIWQYKDKSFTLENGRQQKGPEKQSNFSKIVAPKESKKLAAGEQHPKRVKRPEPPSKSQRNEIIKGLSQIDSQSASAPSPVASFSRPALSARAPDFPFDQPIQAVRPLSQDN